MRLTNKLLQKNVNLSDASPLGNFAKSVIGAAAILAVLYFGIVGLSNLIIPHVSPETEIWLANTMFARQYGDDTGSAQERRLQAMLNAIVATGPALPYAPKVHIEKSDTVNAYALPGGNIVIFTGLLDQVESDNELAFILAHELGHLVHRDHLRGLGRAFAITSINLLFKYIAGIELLPEMLTVYDRSVSRTQESAADRFGIDRVHDLYGHAEGSMAFFERQDAKHHLPEWTAYFSTHPADRERVKALTEYASRKGYRLKASTEAD